MPRSPAQVREHYEIEKALASELRQGTPEQRKRLYGKVYDELFRRVPHHPQLMRMVSADETQRVIRQQLAFLNRFVGRDTVYLEVGCGDCALTFEVAKRARKAIGIDVSAEIMPAQGRPDNVEMILSDGTSIPVPPGSVDIAYSNQLMEHLHPEDARAQLLNLSRALKPGGRYVCVTPNRLTGPHDISRGFDPVATGFHLREYTYTELIELFCVCGFERVAIYSSFRGRYFRVPARLLVAVERSLLHQQNPGRVSLRGSLHRLLDNCRMVAIKARGVPGNAQ